MLKNGRFDSADLNKSGRLETKFCVIKSFPTKGHPKPPCTAPGQLTLFSSTELRPEQKPRWRRPPGRCLPGQVCLPGGGAGTAAEAGEGRGGGPQPGLAEPGQGARATGTRDRCPLVRSAAGAAGGAGSTAPRGGLGGLGRAVVPGAQGHRGTGCTARVPPAVGALGPGGGAQGAH